MSRVGHVSTLKKDMLTDNWQAAEGIVISSADGDSVALRDRVLADGFDNKIAEFLPVISGIEEVLKLGIKCHKDVVVTVRLRPNHRDGSRHPDAILFHY